MNNNEKNSLRTVFFGTSDFAARVLEALKDNSQVELLSVVTQPDKPGGRNLKNIEPPVKKLYKSSLRKIKLYQPLHLAEIEEELKRLEPDLFIVAAYGKMLSRNILQIPQKFAFNIHASLLPRHRGAACINYAIISGDKETGISVFRMTPRLDAGDIMLQRSIKIRPDDTSITLSEKLASLAVELVPDILEKVAAGRADFSPQDDRKATYAPRLKKEDGHIDWCKPAEDIYNLIRGVAGWPGAFTYWQGRRLIVHKVQADLREEEPAAPCGQVLSVEKKAGICVQAKGGFVNIKQLQPEGKKAMSAGDFMVGHDIKPGDTLT